MGMGAGGVSDLADVEHMKFKVEAGANATPPSKVGTAQPRLCAQPWSHGNCALPA